MNEKEPDAQGSDRGFPIFPARYVNRRFFTALFFIN
jgi:hypothetical protein